MEKSGNVPNKLQKLTLTWSGNCVISSNAAANQATVFSITNTKLYVSVVTLPTQENANLFNSYNQVSKEQLTGINISQKYQNRHKTST